MFKKPPVNVGDRFIKIGNYQKSVWIVSKIFQLPSEPPHAHLDKEGNFLDSITVSLPALEDGSLFRRI